MSAPIRPIISRVKRALGIRLGCLDCHRLLFEYAQGTLDPELKQKLDKHLSDCQGCLRYVEEYKETIRACRTHCCAPAEMPPELERRLKEFIAKNL